MTQIDRILVTVGFMWLVLGMLLGLHIGVTANNQLLVVHIAMLLPGEVVSEGNAEDQPTTIDAAFHSNELHVLRALGATGHAHLLI